MKKIKFYWSYISMPLLQYVRLVNTAIRLKKNNPTIKIDGKVSVSKNTLFGRHNFISDGVTLISVTMGDFSYVGTGSLIQNVAIGKFTCIGPSVKIGLGNHPLDFISIHPVFYSLAGQAADVVFADKQYFNEYSPTEIGNDVWIGANVIIPGGVKIGNGAVIASGAVVTKDIPPYAIAGGIPAKIIRYRFPEDKIKDLQEWKWWDKDAEWLKLHFKDMQNIDNLENLMKP